MFCPSVKTNFPPNENANDAFKNQIRALDLSEFVLQ